MESDRFAPHFWHLTLIATERRWQIRTNSQSSSELPTRDSQSEHDLPCAASAGCDRCRSLSPSTPSIHNLFKADRTISSRDSFKAIRTATLSEWRQLCAA
jgi:hypothetical protein